MTILDRMATAGVAWTARTAMALTRTPHTQSGGMKTEPIAKRRFFAPLKRAIVGRKDRKLASAETQQVIAPDQDLLRDSLNIDEAIGIGEQ